ncbi:ABC transporter ATP-binding protein [Alteribacillus sp. HJP-4]|uniref:ABC transporter ATP-binding protein n=1 Tax=Alteribacillus sp. HJP-4 TaxID=2775394 RepID=UPI0035CD206F
MATLTTEKLSIGYGEALIVNDLNIDIPANQITTIIGPNGCGKSTILKTISRLHPSKKGKVYLDGKAIHRTPTRKIANKLAILPQSPLAPDGLTVEELVSYGRSPRQTGFGRLKPHDWDMIEWALEVTGMSSFQGREVDSLSGGQRQRVWIAMALAQETELLLMDEPTTYLDMAHQLDILQLLEKLNREENRTVVLVLHDLNHAARFAHYMIALNNGRVIKEGSPEQLMTSETLKDVFQIDAEIIEDPRTRKPVCVTYDTIK